MRYGRLSTAVAVAAALSLSGGAAATSAVATPAAAVPKLNHVFLIMEENNGFSDVIGNPAAPNLNYLAKTFGLETDYFGVSPDSSESNYVGLLGGSVLGVTSDDAYWKNTVRAPSLISQLDKAGVSWKAYLQALPYAGYQGICYPAKCNGAPDSDPLYVSKHDGIQNFTTSRTAADWTRQVPIGELGSDLASGALPSFSYIVPDECHDMHGDPPYCLDSGNIKDPQNQHLVAVGDAYLGRLVASITHAGFWAKGNNAIIVTYDNGDTSQGCCDATTGGGPVATVVITSHGPRGVKDSQPANHYSTLSTVEHVFGVGCIAFTCDTKNVVPYYKLFQVTGSKSIATKVLPEQNWPTPTPSQPSEPLGTSPSKASAGGWTTQQAQTLGTSFYGGTASGNQAWAVGEYLNGSYQDRALLVATAPEPGSGSNVVGGLTTAGGQLWTAGVYDDGNQRIPLIEHM